MVNDLAWPGPPVRCRGFVGACPPAHDPARGSREQSPLGPPRPNDLEALRRRPRDRMVSGSMMGISSRGQWTPGHSTHTDRGADRDILLPIGSPAARSEHVLPGKSVKQDRPPEPLLLQKSGSPLPRCWDTFNEPSGQEAAFSQARGASDDRC
jgi:hypothetical protein